MTRTYVCRRGGWVIIRCGESWIACVVVFKRESPLVVIFFLNKRCFSDKEELGSAEGWQLSRPRLDPYFETIRFILFAFHLKRFVSNSFQFVSFETNFSFQMKR